MEDADIVELYFRRDQQALEETEAKYGAYLNRISMNVLGNREDAGECVNDACLGAWNAMPPTRPASLRAFLGKIVRRLSLNRLRGRLAERRGGGETALAIEELGELLPADRDTQQEAEARELTRTLNGFLAELPARERDIFMRRYWYFDPLADIAKASGKTEAAVKSQLHRTREKLRDYLDKSNGVKSRMQ